MIGFPHAVLLLFFSTMVPLFVPLFPIVVLIFDAIYVLCCSSYDFDLTQ